MQKVVGSSPIIRSMKPAALGGFFFTHSLSTPERVEARGNEMATAGLAAWLLPVVLRPSRKKSRSSRILF